MHVDDCREAAARVDVVSEAAAVGLSVRPGRAVVVVLRGSRRAPEIVVRYEIQLADPWMPESLHPYHQELGAAGAASAVRARRRGCRAAQKATSRAIRTPGARHEIPSSNALRRVHCRLEPGRPRTGRSRAPASACPRRKALSRGRRNRARRLRCAVRDDSKRSAYALSPPSDSDVPHVNWKPRSRRCRTKSVRRGARPRSRRLWARG